MSDSVIRSHCLELAMKITGTRDEEEIIRVAQAFSSFISNGSIPTPETIEEK